MSAGLLTDVPLDDPRWEWGAAAAGEAEHLGRRCLALGTTVATLAGVELEDGVIELDLAVPAERGFHGVVWRHLDRENFESFFVRPHQTGNPDAVQYTPVFNGISAWQLYHGPGFWAPVRFPLDEWFTIRVAFEGSRAAVFVGATAEPSLVVSALKRPVAAGRIGIQVGGPTIHVARFAYGTGATVGPASAAPAPAAPGVVRHWQVSDAFSESLLRTAPTLPDAFVAERTWVDLEAEASGLVDLARAGAITDDRNTVLARTTLEADREGIRCLDLGFSDRAIVYLNGQPLYRGDDTYRSRDYRFLGSIGYYDSLYLPLRAGANDLLVAVSEDFGGFGVMARLH